MIEKAINLKLMCDYVVSCSYGDIVLIICMLHDYVKMLDEIRKDDINYEVYYRDRFLKKKQKSDDVGEDAMILAIKRGKEKKKKEETVTGGESYKEGAEHE